MSFQGGVGQLAQVVVMTAAAALFVGSCLLRRKCDGQKGCRASDRPPELFAELLLLLDLGASRALIAAE